MFFYCQQPKMKDIELIDIQVNKWNGQYMKWDRAAIITRIENTNELVGRCLFKYYIPIELRNIVNDYYGEDGAAELFIYSYLKNMLSAILKYDINNRYGLLLYADTTNKKLYPSSDLDLLFYKRVYSDKNKNKFEKIQIPIYPKLFQYVNHKNVKLLKTMS